MSSPFVEIDESEWVTSNELAFAIFDAYPVTEGHVLVIPHRVVPTWFEASVDEQQAIMELVEEVKAELDRRFRPDGYNIGINTGAAAGQTVMHLHVHVIPRYEGDMEDPRGGVRHVIPEKGNYLVDSDDKVPERRSSDGSAAVSGLSTGGRDDSFIDHLRPLIAGARKVAVVAAFIQDSGLRLLRDPLLSSLERGTDVRLLTGDYFGITQVDALKRLLDWQDGAEVASKGGSLRVRVVEVARNDSWPRSFHPKSWRFEGRDSGVAFVGSSNISRLALTDGTEWNLRVSRDSDADRFQEIADAFDAQWSRAHKLTSQWVEKYKLRAQLQRPPVASGDVADEISSEVEADEDHPEPEPHAIQRQALQALDEARKAGRRRALIVHATGLGKTWLAAFDIQQFSTHLPGSAQVLFLAHRAEILQQAADTFRTILPDTRFGWFIGSKHNLEGDVVFASVQKLRRPEYLEEIDEDAFDYIVVDEVHHAAAPSYRRILRHLEGEFLLGLTATPDRADEADIRPLFDDFVAHRAPIGEGIEAGFLAPFHYRGLADVTDYEPIPWRSGRFNTKKLTEAVATQERMERLTEALDEHPAERTLIFCCSIDHARFVRNSLADDGMDVAAIYSKPDSDDRDASLRALAAGEIDAVCAVDILNEGIDIPRIDRVVMLRPTESPVVFMQQLGRGLRIAEDKERLLVLDFVGNHRVFLDRMRTLLSLGDKTTSLRQFLIKGEDAELPAGCQIDVDLEAVDLLRDLLPQSSRSSVVREYRELRASRERRPRAVEMHRLGLNLRTLKKYGGWFGFLVDEGDLSPAEQKAWQHGEGWFHELETTSLNKCYKMVVVQTLLDAEALDTGLPVDELADGSHRILVRSPELFDDIVDLKKLPNPRTPEPETWRKYWDTWPLKIWAGDKNRDIEDPWFVREVDGDNGDEEIFFRSRVPVPADGEAKDAFIEMTRELVEFRLAKYRDRFTRTDAGVGAFRSRIISNRRNPIIKLPDRDSHPDIPEGETTVVLPNGQKWRFRFVKIAVNVARPVGDRNNRLPDLLRTWFGPAAGEAGTDFQVEFMPTSGGWKIEPRGDQVIPFPRPDHVIAFDNIAAAAGAHRVVDEGKPRWRQRRVVGEDTPDAHFALQVRGDSMEGGDEPIVDGDWALMKWARGEPLAKVEGRVALVRHVGSENTESTYHLKRVVEVDGGFELRSDNRGTAPISATDDMSVVALCVGTLAASQVLSAREAGVIDALQRELVRRDVVDAYAAGFRREMAQFVELLRGDESFSELLALKSGARRHFAEGLHQVWGIDEDLGAGIVDDVLGDRLN